MRVLCVVGARPNFMKMAPVHQALRRAGDEVSLVHTGQHHGPAMSDIFFQQLDLPTPDVSLDVHGGSHAAQTAAMMARFEPTLQQAAPDCVVVAGDVNSSLATALTAAKAGFAVVHLEAGLRSFDRTMPEEHNRVVIDHLSDLLLTPSADADANLAREGIAGDSVVQVGNCMIDSLRRHADAAATRAPALLDGLGLKPGRYLLVTLHRAGNVDAASQRAAWVSTVVQLAKRCPVVWVTHPRLQPYLSAAALPTSVRLCAPLAYFDFLALQTAAAGVLTDSGGVQEETTALGVPCLTLRANTERPVTVTHGTNTLVGTELTRIAAAVDAILAGKGKRGSIPELWDGHAAERVVSALHVWHERRIAGAT